VLVALTSDQELGLGLAGAIFIAFSLISALLIPRYRPDFPGRKGLGLFIVLTLLMMVGMLGAVVVFGAENESEAAGEHETSAATSGPAETGGGATSPTTGEAPAAGNAQAGKALFAANGCGGCHTYSAAGSTGAVGPNLDEGLKGKDDEYVATSIQNPNADIAPGFQPGIMPTFDQLSEKQVNDLVAFLTQG
jgi:cytochrome c551/c552